RNEQPLERCQTRVLAQEHLEELLSTQGRQRIEAELRVIRLAAPPVLVLRAVVDQQQEPRRRQSLDQAVQEGLRLGIDPVQVFEDQQQGLHLTFAQQHALERIQGALAALGRIQRQEGAVLRQDVQQREQHRSGVLEGVVERQDMPRHLGPYGT